MTVVLLLGSLIVGVGDIQQEGSSRTKPAHADKLRADFRAKGWNYPPKSVFLRAFKQQGNLEVWVEVGPGPMQRIRNYTIAKMSGQLGPKRKRGDLQVPEGVYYVDRLNPQSRFHLSLGLNYPNASDRLRGAADPGGDIFIHGSNVSIGCLAMGDPTIEELYRLVHDVKAKHRTRVQVHIFPSLLGGEHAKTLMHFHPEHKPLWMELQAIYNAFQRTKTVPKVWVDAKGAYRLE